MCLIPNLNINFGNVQLKGLVVNDSLITFAIIKNFNSNIF